jgi:UPF0042 nucleotide-binding protein
VRALSYGVGRRAGAALLRNAPPPSDALRVQAQAVETTLTESIALERELLAARGVRARDRHQRAASEPLRLWVRQFVDSPEASLTLSFESFAFKDGVPVAADLVFDVRNLPNPHYERDLRPLTGRDPEVVAFLTAVPAVAEMIDDIAGFIGKWLPSYVADNRHYLTVAIGCTGGRHRSVYIVEELARRFAGRELVLVRHRAIEPADAR